MVSPTDAEFSRVLSHALRHEPWVYELELDPEGWVDIAQVLGALHAQGPEWSSATVDDIARVVNAAAKQRHEIRGGRIRARYGHSVGGLAPREASDPPPNLLHGTSRDAWGSIRVNGLEPRSRRYVHLSIDAATATEVGRRKGRDVVVITVDAAAASRAGVQFYRGNATVWLADFVPPEFLFVEP
jgi:putative RNA 2'-phosphotransferase